MSPREIFKIRLKSEYTKLQSIAFNGDYYDITPALGEVIPYVQKYWVNYKIPTFVDFGKRMQLQTKIEIAISGSFPMQCPSARVIEGEIPFHVNIWMNDGRIDQGAFWNPGRWIYEYIVYIANILAFNMEYIDVRSPCNKGAIQFFDENRDRFPTISAELLEPKEIQKRLKIRIIP